jgi:hypothetical protein
MALRETLQNGINQSTAAKDAITRRSWQQSFVHCDAVRQTVVLALSNPLLAEEERDKMRAGADNLVQVTGYIHREKLSVQDPPIRFHQPKCAAIESMHTTLVSIQGRLNSIAWEV